MQPTTLSGIPASRGTRTATGFWLDDPSQVDAMPQGAILLTRMTSPDYIEAMDKSSAIVTEVGGMSSHAAIVGRELGKVVVVGVGGGLQALHGRRLLVDGTAGTVTVL